MSTDDKHQAVRLRIPVLAAALLLLVGCGDAPAARDPVNTTALASTTTQATTTTTSPPSTSSLATTTTLDTSPHAIYLRGMRQRPAYFGATDADLIELGRSACGMLDESFDDPEIVRFQVAVVASGATASIEDLWHNVYFAGITLCPEYTWLVEEARYGG